MYTAARSLSRAVGLQLGHRRVTCLADSVFRWSALCGLRVMWQWQMPRWMVHCWAVEQFCCVRGNTSCNQFPDYNVSQWDKASGDSPPHWIIHHVVLFYLYCPLFIYLFVLFIFGKSISSLLPNLNKVQSNTRPPTSQACKLYFQPSLSAEVTLKSKSHFAAIKGKKKVKAQRAAKWPHDKGPININSQAMESNDSRLRSIRCHWTSLPLNGDRWGTASGTLMLDWVSIVWPGEGVGPYFEGDALIKLWCHS